jgi:hypothetical protein
VGTTTALFSFLPPCFQQQQLLPVSQKKRACMDTNKTRKARTGNTPKGMAAYMFPSAAVADDVQY